MKHLITLAAAIAVWLFESLYRQLTNHMHRTGLLLASSAFPNGTVFAISTTFGSDKTITAITNASPPVASSSAHGQANGDIMLLSVAGAHLDQRVARIANQATNTFELEGFDTTSTTLYPSGFGVGTAKAATAFTSLSQTTDLKSVGGEQQFSQWVYLEDGRQRQRKTFRNARALQLLLDYDPTLSWHAALLTADQDGSVRVLRATLPNGAKIYWSVEVSFAGEPSFEINKNQQVDATFSLAAQQSTRYSS